LLSLLLAPSFPYTTLFRSFFSLLRFEISLTVIAALLTLVGYSMNDTIVIFDRIRENNRLLRRELFASVVNKSINQTRKEFPAKRSEEQTSELQSHLTLLSR